ncbi:MAG: Inositol 1, 3, 4-trisphosphate 5/6-kinase [Promethearchaeota archaeon]|nr:MAG: Inositol 1, 3, 4-trisphosphate 5/6-kinase [Candidatus Lokiarchaeota archaeon]
MKKHILISAKSDLPLIEKIINRLKTENELKLDIHDPIKDSIHLKDFYEKINDYNLIIAKVAGESSIDLLHMAQLFNIPTINNLYAILNCKNKIALDSALRHAFKRYEKELTDFNLPESWIHPSPLKDLNHFKDWAISKLPLVFKSHDQHNEFFRFNFLARDQSEIDDFILSKKDFLYFDLYIQEFIDCDGIDRKVYVVGDKIFGIQRENPIYIFLRDKPNSIDVDEIERKEFKLDEKIKKLSKILSKELNLSIFGFDLVKPLDKNGYYLLDLNDFPGFRGIKNIDQVIVEYILDYLEGLENNK